MFRTTSDFGEQFICIWSWPPTMSSSETPSAQEVHAEDIQLALLEQIDVSHHDIAGGREADYFLAGLITTLSAGNRDVSNDE